MTKRKEQPPIVNNERRIRKHIHGQLHTFEVDAPPGFIDLCERWTQKIIEGRKTTDVEDVVTKKKSGRLRVEKAPFELCHDLLLRGSPFSDLKIQILKSRCSSEDKLQALLESVPWELWIPNNRKIEWDIRVDSLNSRLYNEGRIKKLATLFLNKKAATKIDTLPLQIAIDLTLERESLEIFLSLGGRDFWQRGQKQNLQHAAPLREDLASCLVVRLAELSDAWTSGMKPSLILNPFCGTGTLLHESALHLTRIGQTLSLEKSWIYPHLPFFKTAAFTHCRKKILEEIKRVENIQPVTFVGEDKDPILTKATQSWFESVSFSEKFLFETQVIQKDSCEWSAGDKALGKNQLGWILANPPFGIRLSNTSQGGTEKMYTEFAKRILRSAELSSKSSARWTGVVLCPGAESWLAMKKVLQGWSQKCEHFTLGGLDIRAFYFSSPVKKK